MGVVLFVKINVCWCLLKDKVFNRTGRLFRKAFIFANKKIDTIREYIYIPPYVSTKLEKKSYRSERQSYESLLFTSS